MKTKLAVLLTMAIMCIVVVAPAQAVSYTQQINPLTTAANTATGGSGQFLATTDSQMTFFPDGHYAVTEASISATKTATTGNITPMSSTDLGWGGTATSSGSADAHVTTVVYSILGIKVYSVTSGVHFSWSNGIVQTHTRYEPTLQVDFRIPATSCTMTRDWGQQWAFAWNGKATGGWYTSVVMHVKQAIMKYGIYGNMDITHEYKLQGNGRFWWRWTM